MDPLDRINALIDLAIARGDRAAMLILQSQRRIHLQLSTDRRTQRTLEASRASR